MEDSTTVVGIGAQRKRRKNLTASPKRLKIKTFVPRMKENLYEPKSNRKIVACASLRERTGTTTTETGKKQNNHNKVVEMPSGRGRTKTSALIPAKQRNGRSGNAWPLVVEDVLLEKLHNVVPDVEELQKKREADTIRCGRSIRIAGNTLTRNCSEYGSWNASKDNAQHRDQTAIELLEPQRLCSNLSPNNRKANRDHVQAKTAEILAGKVSGGFLKPPINRGIARECSDRLLRTVRTTRNDASANFLHTVQNVTMIGDANVQAFEPLVEAIDNQDHYRRGISAVMDSTNEQERNLRERQPSPIHGNWSQHGRCGQSESQSRHDHQICREETSALKSPRQSRSPSRGRSSIGRQQRKTSKYYVEEEWINLPARTDIFGAQNNRREHRRETLHQRIQYSSSTEGGYKYRASLLPNRRRTRGRTICSSSTSESPYTPFPTEAYRTEELEETRAMNQHMKDLSMASSAIDRRTRRYKQAVRKAEKYRRKKEGKKAFYVTLDVEGKPYGPGKPAWVAEVNKLATALDPSCTHIRKQTHEDMCILKDRLKDNFEYSGDLNEDYLRGLLGKAVTRKRTQLIALIKNNGSQPLHVNKVVWERLTNLANSIQRESKSEHGRYANACRKMMGRTGPLGEDGLIAVNESRGKQQDNNSWDMVDHEVATQRDGRVQLMYRRDKVMVPRGIGIEREREGLFKGNLLSTEEYIARLEAELRSLRGDTEARSSSRKVLRYEADGRRGPCSDYFDDGNGQENTKRSEKHAHLH